MRDALFFLIFLPMPVAAVLYPWVGLLLWCWIAFMSPQRELWGFAGQIPYNQIIAIATMVGWLVSREVKTIPINATIVLLFLLVLLLALSTFNSLAPESSLDIFMRYMKHWVLLFAVPIFLISPVRIHTFVWMMAFSLGYFGIEGGALFIISAGQHQFSGPSASQIGDNNHLALAMVTAIPLMNYLRLQSERRLIRIGLAATMVMTSMAVVGTHSRGGFIALCTMAAILFWKSKGRMTLLAVGGLAIIAVMELSSAGWVERMQTIETAAEEDNSFRARLVSWQVYANAGLQRPLTGAGLKALEWRAIYDRYMPDTIILEDGERPATAAHSMYFQVLGEAGVLAFVIYLSLMALAWRNAGWIRRRASRAPETVWMSDLARMGQVSIAAFAVGGAAVSMAFYDYFLVLLVLLAVLKRICQEQLETHRTVPAETSDWTYPAPVRDPLSHGLRR